jgi:heme-degrading monooxygenase HmoA
MNGIELHTDLNVDETREMEFLLAFGNFLRIARDAPGFIDAKLLKLRRGEGDERRIRRKTAHGMWTRADLKYRLVQWWESEDARCRWRRTDEHHAAWHPLEQPLRGGSRGVPFTGILFDVTAAPS